MPLEQTVAGVEAILGGECDDIAESHFLMCGTINDVYAKARQ